MNELAPTRSSVKPLNKINTLQEMFEHPDFKARIQMSLPKHLQPDWMLRTFIQCVQKTPKLAKCSPLSLMGAFLTCASVGMAPNSPLGHIYLIPYDVTKWNPQTRQRDYIRTDVNLQFGYPGLLDLARRSGLVQSVHCDVVYENEVKSGNFSYEYGTNKHLRHKPTGKQQPDEEPVYAYAHVRLVGGDDQFEVMTWAEVMSIRAKSQAFQSALWMLQDAEKNNRKPPAAWTEAPWVKWVIPMAKKTAFRKMSNWLPKSIEMAGALALEDAQERGSVNFAQVVDGTASILDGGLDAIADEMSVTTEKKEPAPAEPTTAKQQEQTQPKQPDPATSDDGPSGDTSYDLWLLDANGEPAEDFGSFGLFHDAVLFAEAYVKLVGQLPDQAIALAEQNADSLADARQNSEAAAILAPAQEPSAAIPMPLGSKNLAAYVKTVEATLASVTSLDALAAFDGDNRPVYEKLPPKTRTQIKAMVEARGKALATPPPKQNSAPPTDKEKLQATQKGIMRDILACKTLDDLIVIQRNASIAALIARIEREAPELAPELGATFKRRRDEIMEARAAPPSTEDDDPGFQP